MKKFPYFVNGLFRACGWLVTGGGIAGTIGGFWVAAYVVFLGIFCTATGIIILSETKSMDL